ncbi:hypothetical protein [Acidovorax sp.]|uniref:hypothetical protein n=1 Tax=Acidovorax sp. TaxID=1872122 RepID=UPI002ACE54FB|nr:hypothetical protein [Acidovorax sp.]MDZ7863361.1 hypothetical protein [Acidovorax sp.]
MKAALLDTSFLISLSNPDRAQHPVALRYFKEMLVRGTVMHLSTIVIAEYEVRQRITDLGLQNFIVQPFNIDHGIAAASLFMPFRQAHAAGYDRVAIKDDTKLLAQCELLGIGHYVTGDSKCCANIESLKKALPGRALPFGVSCDLPYDDAWFNAGNQAGLGY